MRMVSFPVPKLTQSVNFVSTIQYYYNKCIYMNFRIKMIFQYVSAWLGSAQSDVIGDGVWLSAALGDSSPQNFSCMIKAPTDKKLKHCNVNVNYKNISHYILLVFIILPKLKQLSAKFLPLTISYSCYSIPISSMILSCCMKNFRPFIKTLVFFLCIENVNY